MREIEIVSTSTNSHFLLFGMNSSELGSFKIQLWITKYGKRYIDWASTLGMSFVTFMGGDLWLHNDDSVPRCNLYGEQKDCEVGIVTNENPIQVKLFDSLGIHSDGKWEVSEVIIPPSLNYPNGMYSKIPAEQFKNRDGVWKAKFMRNMKSTDSVARVIDAIKGEVMRGYECYFVLKNVNNPNGDEVKIFKVDVNCSSSRI
jgi:hypothetical protein